MANPSILKNPYFNRDILYDDIGLKNFISKISLYKKVVFICDEGILYGIITGITEHSADITVNREMNIYRTYNVNWNNIREVYMNTKF